jgi:Holliday junction resolvase RusA-like endonuclease
MRRLPDREPDLAVTVYGDAKTKGSVSAHLVTRGDGSIVTRPNGRPMVIKHDDTGAKGKQWLGTVAQAVAVAMSEQGMSMVPAKVPVVLEMVFFRPRNVSHYGTGRNAELLKDSAPALPAVKPDIDKLARAILDALKGIAWHDDGQVTGAPAWKEFGTPARVELRVWRLPASVAEVAQLPATSQTAQTDLFSNAAPVTIGNAA